MVSSFLFHLFILSVNIPLVKVQPITMNKILFLLIILLFSLSTIAQNQKHRLLSDKLEVDFVDGGIFYNGGWTADPQIELDAHKVLIHDTIKKISFYSEIDSISFYLNPDTCFDFDIVVKDETAKTRICADSLSLPKLNFTNEKYETNEVDTIDIKLREDNRPYLYGHVNNSKKLSLLFDTGAGSNVLDATKMLPNDVQLSSKIDTIINRGIDGITKVVRSVGNEIQISNFKWEDETCIVIDYRNAKFDGVLSWKVFENAIVEINNSDQILVVHKDLPDNILEYSRIEMMNSHGVHYIPVTFRLGKEKIVDWFEFDTGFSKTLNVNYEFSIKHDLYNKLKLLHKDQTSGSASKDISVDKVLLPELHIGEFEMYQIPISLVDKIEQGIDHNGLIGNAIMKRFDLIIDYRNNFLYIKPNRLINSPYKIKTN